MKLATLLPATLSVPPLAQSPNRIAWVIGAEAATRAIVDIFATGDLDVVASAVADDYVDHQGLGDIEIRGRDGFRQVVEAVRKYSDMRVTIEDMVAAEDKAAVRLRWHGIDPSGRTVIRETLDLLRFHEGRLVEHWGAQLFRRESYVASSHHPHARPVQVASPGRGRRNFTSSL